MRRALFASTTVLCLVACSGGSSTNASDGGASGSSSGSSDGSSDAGAHPARMIVRTNGGTQGACLPTFAIGSFEPARPIDDNTKDGDRLVRVQCTVAPSGDGYLVHAAAVVDGLGPFQLHVGKLPASGNHKGSPSEISIGWGKDTGTISDATSQCMVDTTFDPIAGVAPGRYWAAFSCTGLKTKDAQPCNLAGELRLENCVQTP